MKYLLSLLFFTALVFTRFQAASMQEPSEISLRLIDTIPDVYDFDWGIGDNLITFLEGSSTPYQATVCSWNATSKDCEPIKTYSLGIWSTHVSPDGKMIAVGLVESVEIIDAVTKVKIATLVVAGENFGGVEGVSWSHNGSYIAIGGTGAIYIFSTNTWLLERILNIPPDPYDHYFVPVNELEWSPDDRYIASEYLSIAATVEILDVIEVATGNALYHSGSRGFSWVGEGKLFSYVSGSSIITVVSETFEQQYDYSAPNARSMSWSPNGELLTYFLREESRLVTIHFNTGDIVLGMSGDLGLPQVAIKDTAWSDDGRYFAVLGGNDLFLYEVVYASE